MQLSPSTSSLLSSIEALSGGRLSRGPDLGVLIELGSTGAPARTLDDLSFLAKFLAKTYGIMRRIGRDGEGYERLEAEFTRSMETSRDHLRDMLAGAPPEVRNRFEESYLAMTPDGMQNLMALYGDLAWYKNWRLDQREPGT